MDDLKILENSRLFAGIRVDEIQPMLSCLQAVERKYPRGAISSTRARRCARLRCSCAARRTSRRRTSGATGRCWHHWRRAIFCRGVCNARLRHDAQRRGGCGELHGAADGCGAGALALHEQLRVPCPPDGKPVCAAGRKRTEFWRGRWTILPSAPRGRSCWSICPSRRSAQAVRSLRSRSTGSSWPIFSRSNGARCPPSFRGCRRRACSRRGAIFASSKRTRRGCVLAGFRVLVSLRAGRSRQMQRIVEIEQPLHHAVDARIAPACPLSSGAPAARGQRPLQQPIDHVDGKQRPRRRSPHR